MASRVLAVGAAAATLLLVAVILSPESQHGSQTVLLQGGSRAKMMAQMRNIARMNGRKEMLSHFEDMQHFQGDPRDPEQDRRASEEAVQAEKEIMAVNKVQLPSETSIPALIAEEAAMAAQPVANVTVTAPKKPDPTLKLLSAQVDSLRKAVTWLLLKDTAPATRIAGVAYPRYPRAAAYPPVQYGYAPGAAAAASGYVGDSWGGAVGPGGQGFYVRGSGAYRGGYWGGRGGYLGARGGYQYPVAGYPHGGSGSIDSGIRRMQFAALQGSEPPLMDDSVDLQQ